MVDILGISGRAIYCTDNRAKKVQGKLSALGYKYMQNVIPARKRYLHIQHGTMCWRGEKWEKEVMSVTELEALIEKFNKTKEEEVEEKVYYVVNSRDESNAVQKHLFAQGYQWVGGVPGQLWYPPESTSYPYAIGVGSFGKNKLDWCDVGHYVKEGYTRRYLPTVPATKEDVFEPVFTAPEDAPVVSDGKSTSYYKVAIKRVSDGETFECEMGDIIASVVGNDFNLGNILKAARRMYEATQGRGKKDVSIQYDANKIGYFAEDFAKRNQKGGS